ncbi:hypothetical protein Ancab_038210 [Ancistrocladus abbreviatus]
MEINETGVPPGFRFHPTEEELVGYYLKRKINSLKIDLNVIVDIDLCSIEPWEVQDRCKLGYEEQTEWYFFSHKDKKYPTGTRTNRATAAGFWKATGRDKAVLSKNKIIGMRKTLVFYKGRAPNGRRTDWIMHEYRLQSSEHAPSQEEGWVVCRAFKKPSPSHSQGFEAWNHPYYFRNSTHIVSPSVPDVASPVLDSNQACTSFCQQLQSFGFDQEYLVTNDNANAIDQHKTCINPTDNNQLVDLPQLDSPSVSTSFATNEGFKSTSADNYDEKCSNNWNFFNSMVASQILHPDCFTRQLHAYGQVGNFLECFPTL